MKSVLLILCLFPMMLWAQVFKVSPEDLVRKQSVVLLRDGTTVHGQILRQDSTIITVRKRNGDNSFIEADQVVRIAPNHASFETVSGPDVSSQPAPYDLFIFRDGTQVEGKFVRRDSTMITVRKRNGQLTYFEPELLIRVDSTRLSTNPVSENSVLKRQFLNRFSPWLLTGQTAYNAEKGKFYYRNILLFRNEFYYGITRNWSLGATVNPFFAQLLINNTARQTAVGATVNFNTKLTFPIGEQFRFGVNVIYQPRQQSYFGSLSEQFVLQGLMSFGTSQRNATLGYGMRLYTQYANRNKQPFITAGVMHRISRNLTILSDNTFYLNTYLGGQAADLSLALRLNRQRHAFDIGVVSTVQPQLYYDLYSGYNTPGITTYFYPYIAYNLLIGRG